MNHKLKFILKYKNQEFYQHPYILIDNNEHQDGRCVLVYMKCCIIGVKN